MPRLFSFLVAAGLALASTSSATCTNPTERKAWTKLKDAEKSEYLPAEVCLMETPSKTGFAGSLTVWDEFQTSHISQVQFVHGVGAFFPWHRLYMKAHEVQLRGTCGYTGPLPYWDEQADQTAAPLADSSIWDATHGFGSNRFAEDGCIIDGPFPGGFRSRVSGSGRDPLFFMHHTNLDRLWWEWQSQNTTTRLTDMSGINVGFYDILIESQPPTLPPATAFSPYFYESPLGDGTQTTLNHTLWVNGIIPNATIADVMDIMSDTICSVYV